MTELRVIGMGGPSVAVYTAPTGQVFFVEDDLAGLAAMSCADLNKIGGKRGAEVVEVDGRRIAMRTAAWVFDLAERSDAPHALRPLWHAARRLMRATAETGLKTWIGQARPLARR